MEKPLTVKPKTDAKLQKSKKISKGIMEHFLSLSTSTHPNR